MAKIALLVGTTLGGTEYVADDMAAQLSELGHETSVFMSHDLDQIMAFDHWLIVSSTHGAGDLPDNIEPFYQAILSIKPNLDHIKYALCAIGDSSYDTFCQGPEKIITQLEKLGSQAFVNKIQIDIQSDPIPEIPALAWLTEWQDKL